MESGEFMIRFVAAEDFARISRIWQTCFGDPEDYVRFFFDHCLPLCRGLVYEIDGKPAAMAFLLPGALRLQEESFPASYVYAVATLPAYRRRGAAAALMAHAASLARGEGQAALCLRPGSEGLYGYYAKLGYVTGFARQDFTQAAREGIPQKFQPAPAADFRDACWGRLGYFAWAPPLLGYMAKEHLFRGGEILLEESGYLLGIRDQDTGYRIRERCVCAPADEPGGMVLPLNEAGRRWLAGSGGRGYLGLTLE